MGIVIIYCPVFDVINFEIIVSFVIKSFFYITQTSGQKCKYLKNKNRFYHKGLSVIRKCLWPESEPLRFISLGTSFNLDIFFIALILLWLLFDVFTCLSFLFIRSISDIVFLWIFWNGLKPTSNLVHEMQLSKPLSHQAQYVKWIRSIQFPKTGVAYLCRDTSSSS